MLRTEGVVVRFGGVNALSGVGLDVAAGAITGLIGPNGAGKTTLFNVITGLQTPNEGTVTLDGLDVTKASASARARLGLGRTFQRLEVFGSLTVKDNVLVALEASRGRTRAQRSARADELLERVGLARHAGSPAGVLSTGSARLLELARAMACDPKVLLLDEVSSGLDSNESEEVGDLLVSLAAAGLAVLLVEHDMDMVMRICTHIHVLDFGVLIASGAPLDIQRNQAVQSAYLGVGGAADETRPPSVKVVAEHSAHGDARLLAAPSLELRDVRASYDQFEILHGINLKIEPSTVTALLGPNGAGKTTTLRAISGRLRLTSGEVLVDGLNVAKASIDRLARNRMCSIPEGRGVFPNLTVSENLRMWTYRGHDVRPADVEAEACARFPVLARRRNQVAGTLSGGEQQMLAMSRALSTHPRLLLLDEISMGLAPLVVAELYELVRQIAAEGVTILLVEQFAQTALRVADRAAVLVRGHIELEGTPTEVSDLVADIYMSSKR